MLNAWRSLDLVRKIVLVVGALLLARLGYSTIAWLLTSRPAGALVPGVFLYFFASLAYARLRSDFLHEAVVRSTGTYLITGAASAVSIAVLWTLAVRGDDDIYRDQALSMSIWGGATVVVAALTLITLATPRGRKNMRAQRAAALGDAATSQDPAS